MIKILNQIEVTKSVRLKLNEEFDCVRHTIKNALNDTTKSELSDKIRKRAVELMKEETKNLSA